MYPPKVIKAIQDAFIGIPKDLTRETECESPIETLFQNEFRKFANDEITIRGQFKCQTQSGSFRLDYLLENRITGEKIGIECDGADFHSVERDSKRDASIIRSGLVNKIYRLRGRDITSCIHDLFQLLSKIEPDIFSERAGLVFESICRPAKWREDVIYRHDKKFTESDFPHSAMRVYHHPEIEDEDFFEYDGFEPLPRKPTIISWTEI